MNTLQNRVQLIGNLGQDPEVKEFEDGKKYAKFSVATTDSYRNAEGKKVQDTQWHQVIAWGKLADLSEKFLKKGRKVAIDGKLTHKRYEDKNGITKYFTEVIVNELLLLDSPNSDDK